MNEWNINPECLLELSVNGWIYWKDAKGSYLGCNELLARDMLYSSPREIIGKFDYQLPILEEEIIQYRNEDQYVMESACTMHFEDFATLPNAKFKFHTIKLPLFTQKGKLTGILGFSYYESIAKIINKPSDEGILLEMPLAKRIINGIIISSKEANVLHYLVRGKTAKEIAKLLNLSQRTVEQHIDNVKIKLKANSKSKLIDIIFDHFK